MPESKISQRVSRLEEAQRNRAVPADLDPLDLFVTRRELLAIVTLSEDVPAWFTVGQADEADEVDTPPAKGA